jgi:DNA replication protein DnaC
MDETANATIQAKLAKIQGQAAIDAPPETALERKAMNEAIQAQHLRQHLSACGVPTRAFEIIAADGKLSQTEAIKATREWARSSQTFLVLRGKPGCGKTLAAGAVLMLARKARYFMGEDGKILSSWAYSSRDGLFVRAAELAGLAPWAEGEGRWADVRDVTWLVLDDLGMERRTDVWAEQLDLLVDVRYQSSLRTLITTNLGIPELERRYGGRLLRRVRETGTIAECDPKAGA